MRYQTIYQPSSGLFEVVRFTSTLRGIVSRTLYRVSTYAEALVLVPALREGSQVA